MQCKIYTKVTVVTEKEVYETFDSYCKCELREYIFVGGRQMAVVGREQGEEIGKGGAAQSRRRKK